MFWLLYKGGWTGGGEFCLVILGVMLKSFQQYNSAYSNHFLSLSLSGEKGYWIVKKFSVILVVVIRERLWRGNRPALLWCQMSDKSSDNNNSPDDLRSLKCVTLSFRLTKNANNEVTNLDEHIKRFLMKQSHVIFTGSSWVRARTHESLQRSFGHLAGPGHDWSHLKFVKGRNYMPALNNLVHFRQATFACDTGKRAPPA